MGRAAQTRRIALERMGELVMAAARAARADPALAAGQAAAARAISTRHRVRMPYGLRIAFCKKCKSFAAPGSGSRVRIGGSQTRAVRITCLLCGHTYRRILPRGPGQAAGRRRGEARAGAPASPDGGAGAIGAAGIGAAGIGAAGGRRLGAGHRPPDGSPRSGALGACRADPGGGDHHLRRRQQGRRGGCADDRG